MCARRPLRRHDGEMALWPWSPRWWLQGVTSNVDDTCRPAPTVMNDRATSAYTSLQRRVGQHGYTAVLPSGTPVKTPVLATSPPVESPPYVLLCGGTVGVASTQPADVDPSATADPAQEPVPTAQQLRAEAYTNAAAISQQAHHDVYLARPHSVNGTTHTDNQTDFERCVPGWPSPGVGPKMKGWFFFRLLRRALSGPYAGAVVPLRTTSAEGDGVTGDAAVRPCAAIGPSVEPIRPAQQQDALHRDVRSHAGRIAHREMHGGWRRRGTTSNISTRGY